MPRRTQSALHRPRDLVETVLRPVPLIMVGRPDSPASNFDLFLKAVGRERQDRLGSEIAYLLAHLSQAIFEGGEVLAMVAPDEFVLAIGETVEPIATEISRRMNPEFYVIALIQNYYLSSISEE